MIKVTGLTKRFSRHTVLDDVTFQISSGERVAVLGLNGAGKTTLFRCLMGLTSFDGSITVGGANVIRDGKAARTALGYVPQRAPHFEGTLQDVVGFFCRLRNAPYEDICNRLKQANVSIETYGTQPVNTLSGGMLQKVLLTIALGAGVKVLILDEPTANLDPHARRDFLHMLQSVPESVTVLLSSHQLSDVEAVARRIIILEQGTCVCDGQIDDLSGRGLSTALLWVTTDRINRAAAIEILEVFGGVEALKDGHGRIGVQIGRSDGAKALGALDANGIAVHDFSFDTPTVEDLLANVLGTKAEVSVSTLYPNEAHTA